MKSALLLVSILLSSVVTFAASEKIAESKGDGYQLLDLVVNVQSVYSQTSELEAKVFELLAGDGVNPTRMVLSLNTGYADAAHVYELQEMMYKVTRVTFLAKDVIVINYVQDSYADADAMVPVQVDKSLKITVLRDAKGQLTEEILTEDISK